jgi:predicted O-methyltransferase YrrM
MPTSAKHRPRKELGVGLQAWIAKLYRDKDLTRMGHLQRAKDRNLGLGWIYYGLARTVRSKTAVVIGSYRGFVPLVLGKALADNDEGGEVIFIDPSRVDDFWKDADAVRKHFARHGVKNIRHFLMTTQEFARSDAYRALPSVGILFVDGHHSKRQAKFDFKTFEGRLAPGGLALFHDTARYRVSKMHGRRTYTHRVKDYVDELKLDPKFQVLDLPYADGVSIVRKLGDGLGDG